MENTIKREIKKRPPRLSTIRPRIKKAFEIYTEKMTDKMNKGKSFSMAEVLKEAGYSEATAVKPCQITNSDSWKYLLARYPDEPILDLVYQDAMGQGREANENRKLFFKMKGRLKDSISLDVNKERISIFDED